MGRLKSNLFSQSKPMEEAKSRMNDGTLVTLKFRSAEFKLEKAVCNHGFFMMAPNQWDPSTNTLHRPLRLADSITSVDVSISQGHDHEDDDDVVDINIWVHSIADLSWEDKNMIERQVGRMLRVSEKDERDVREFHQLHSSANKKGFGRLFRSPNLFEDVIKSLLLCNCTWSRSLMMAKSLCELQSELSSGMNNISVVSGSRKRKRELDDELTRKFGNFPSARELANLNEKLLNERCKLGYRAKHIVKLAKEIESGSFEIDELEEETLKYKQVYKKLSTKKGFGPFACANVLMCIGFYQMVPTDSETIRHIKQTHERETCCKKTVEKHVDELYDKYSPFQCLAYWMEMLEYYEGRLGKLSELPHSSYHATTGSLMLR